MAPPAATHLAPGPEHSTGACGLNDSLAPRESTALLDRSTQEVLADHAHTLSKLARNTAQNLWEMGRILADAQDRLASANGTFVHWVKNDAGMSVGMAYRLINVYRAFRVSTLETANFERTALYLLSEPSTPAPARQEAVRRAERGESITSATARQIVDQYRPMPPSPEYSQFEREELLPKLHDAGVRDAPQMLSGQCKEIEHVSEERKEQVRISLRETIVNAIRGIDTEAEEALGACADEVLEILGQGHNSIAIAARIGAALASGPKTLADLTSMCIVVCGESAFGMEREDYLDWRKRVVRLVDALTFCNGSNIYEHKLANGQIVLSLMEGAPDG